MSRLALDDNPLIAADAFGAVAHPQLVSLHWTALPSAWAPAADYFERRVGICAVDDMWSVDVDGLEPVWFRTLRDAEQYARKLVWALTELGLDVNVEVLDRCGHRRGLLRFGALTMATRNSPSASRDPTSGGGRDVVDSR